MRWVLPDYIQDALPDEAARIERLRRLALDVFRGHGYQLVFPPMLEYLDGLTTGAGQDLELKTFKLVDQLSGRTMGVRADMTPQVARIDAHLLNHAGVSRLCYCGSVLHTLPSTLTASREPIQLGAELYGHAGLEADAEIIRLLSKVLEVAGVPPARIDLGHVALFRALASGAGLTPEREEAVFDLLQGKDVPSLREALADVDVRVREALLTLPTLYGGLEVLQKARACLPGMPEVDAALSELERLAGMLEGLPVRLDLADLRGYHYHNGVVFAVYVEDLPAALALGGRYDQVGAAFGRGRPATGFSLDLREMALRNGVMPSTGGILAPQDSDDVDLSKRVRELRRQGEVVVERLPGHEGTWRAAGCDRQLIKRDRGWEIVALEGEE